MRRVIFMGSALLILYTYVLFPVIVFIRGVALPRPVNARAIEPRVSILIAARNEAAVIGAKLRNLAELEYPPERVQVVVASDGSTDATSEIVAEFARTGPIEIRLLELGPTGKANALNAAVEASDGEVLVFSDANSMYARDALRALVRPLADPTVGGVAGNQVYAKAGVPGDSTGERGYWGYDRMVKEFESRAGNTIAGTGAIYAIRRTLFRSIPPGVNDDFFQTAGIVHQGQRLVFAGDAIAFEAPAPVIGAEYVRKVRVISRAMRCIQAMPELLDPRRHGFYSIQLLSHKVLRWAMGVPLATLLLSSAVLARQSAVHGVAFLAQLAFYCLAIAGTVARGTRVGTNPLLSVPAYFAMVNIAALRAAWNLAMNRRIDHWEPARDPAASAPGAASVADHREAP